MMHSRTHQQLAAGLLLLAATFCGCATEVATRSNPNAPVAEAQRVVGTSVWLRPPPGYAVADSFTGFIDIGTGASIMVTEMATPSQAMIAEMTKPNLATRGIQMKKRSEAKFGIHDGILIRGTQFASGVAAFKYMGVFGDETKTLMVVANAPGGIRENQESALRDSVNSATYLPTSVVDQFDGLSYRIRETERLKINRRIQNSLSVAPPDTPTVTIYPFMIVGPSLNPVAVSNLENLARQRLLVIKGLTEITTLESKTLTAGGRDTDQILATAKDVDSGETVDIFQAITLHDTYYYLIQGFANRNQSDEFMAEFETVANSLTFPTSQ